MPLLEPSRQKITFLRCLSMTPKLKENRNEEKEKALTNSQSQIYVTSPAPEAGSDRLGSISESYLALFFVAVAARNKVQAFF